MSILGKDLENEITGKKAKIYVTFGTELHGGTIPKVYEGIVNCFVYCQSNAFIQLDNGALINIEYIQTIEL